MSMQLQEMAALTKDALTLDKIEEWAKTKEETEIVGHTSEPCWCPVAKYLLATVPQRVVGSVVCWEVGAHVVHVRGPMTPSGYDTVVIDTPPQIRALVGQIDDLGEGDPYYPVDAQQFLGAIAGVRGEAV